MHRLQRFAVAVVDADPAVCDAALGDEESQQPGHVLVDSHIPALWRHGPTERHSIASIRKRLADAITRPSGPATTTERSPVTFNDAAAHVTEATHTVSGAKRMAGEVNDHSRPFDRSAQTDTGWR